MRSLVILAAVAAMLLSVVTGCGKSGSGESATKPGTEDKTAGVQTGQTCPPANMDCSTQKIEVRNTKGDNKKFFEAVMKDDIATVSAMLKKDKRFLDIRNIKNATPLHVAAKTGKPKCAKALIDAGAKVDAVNAEGRTPLHAAATHGRMDIAKLLVASKASVNAASDNGGTPLHDAVIRNNMAMIKFLLANGANINAATKRGVTPLIAALARNKKEVAKFLIDKGANFDAKKLAAAMSGDAGATRNLPKEEFCCENL